MLHNVGVCFGGVCICACSPACTHAYLLVCVGVHACVRACVCVKHDCGICAHACTFACNAVMRACGPCNACRCGTRVSDVCVYFCRVCAMHSWMCCMIARMFVSS